MNLITALPTWLTLNGLLILRLVYIETIFIVILTFYRPLDDDSVLSKQHARLTLQLAEEQLEKGTFPREDYRELLELTDIFWRGDLPGERKFTMRKPGAHHRARFMHQAIYFLKMQLLSEQFAMSQKERAQVNEQFLPLQSIFNNNIPFIRSKEWLNISPRFIAALFLRARLSSSAPNDDWLFLIAMYSYR